MRGLSSGVDPARLLHDTLRSAVEATKARQGLLVGVVDGRVSPLASTGATPAVVLDAAEAAVSSGRLVRRSERDGSVHAMADAIRIGGRIVGALSVGGLIDDLDPRPLPLFTDVGALVLSRRPQAGPSSVPEFLDALASVAADLDQASVLVRVFDAAEQLFGAQSGFCALFVDGGARIGHYRGLDREALRDATRHPEFRALLTAPTIRIDPPTHPVIGRLVHGAETAVGLPLHADNQRIGHLVLLLGEPPDAATRAALTGFANHVALSLRSAELYRRVGDKEEQLASVVHSMPNPVVVVDDAGCFVMVNGAASELFRLAGAFEVGQPAAGKLGNTLLEEMLGETARDEQVELPLGEPGSARLYRASSRRVHSSGGRSLGRVMVLHDISSEQEADRLKSDFVAVVGHELRTPLTVMKGYIRTLIRRGATIDDSSREMALKSIESNSNRLERLIEDLLLVSTIEAGRPKVQFEDEDILEILRTHDDERVQVRRRRPLLVTLDRPKVEQVLHHLVDNALKYSEGPVVLDAVDTGDAVEVSVTDSGPGIFSGDVPRLFDRFLQLDGSSTRAHGGTGIGLYICKRLVEAYGGEIWCESRLGVGSRFAFSIPRDVEDELVMPIDEISSASL
ncbi:MAG: two-component system, OmpR family, phosphate regulon sensor histidine kinase PhoR [Actinomycetota bacterium]|nr:two-component system, OmpR family, phosphate regulon sensor histidine kinase PhoR [Actinomycetota bacterium]